MFTTPGKQGMLFHKIEFFPMNDVASVGGDKICFCLRHHFCWIALLLVCLIKYIQGLNVFNTSCVLADQHSATDIDFERVQGIVGHEYFHNWTGNRVTCRDWFQLTLKEGLTVFRDQEFSADMTCSKAVLRIEKKRNLGASQFRGDAGPMSHPIRPDSYISMDNFYTTTVYRKGAEIIRMYQTILGGEVGFRKGMDLYFQRYFFCLFNTLCSLMDWLLHLPHTISLLLHTQTWWMRRNMRRFSSSHARCEWRWFEAVLEMVFYEWNAYCQIRI